MPSKEDPANDPKKKSI
jgi:hypothetical protein